MIRALGIDSVEIARFIPWATYPKKSLLRVFGEEEIDYCLSIPAKSAERFATRFAAREAFFKALAVMIPDHGVPFLTVCKNITVQSNPQRAPTLLVNWKPLPFAKAFYTQNKIHLSATHTRNIATVIIIVES